MAAKNRRTIVRRWIPGLFGLATLFALAWCGWQLVPRDSFFLDRRGVIERAQSDQELAGGGAFVSESVRLGSSSGLEVSFRVLRPPGDAVRVPVVVIMGGHRTGRDAVDLVGNPGQVAVVALDYPYDGPERPRGLRQSLATIPAVRRALLDTPAAALLVRDWLALQPWVDADRVEIVGASLGGPFATIVGALDPRFRRVWVIHAGADLRAWLGHNLESRIGNSLLRWVAARILYVLARGRTFEPGRWIGRIAPRPVVIVGAENDERLPPILVERLRGAASPGTELLWMTGGHVNPDEREIVQELLELVRSRVTAEP
jgi:dienelactone hydrolase